MNATLPRPAIKSTVVIFAPAFVSRLRNPHFGFGLAPDRRLPVGPTAADEAFAKGECPSTAYSEAEWFDHVAATTMSADERLDFLAHVRSAELDRYAAADSAEWDELGIDPTRMEELAEEAAQLDAACGFDFSVAVVEVAPVAVAKARKSRKAPTTRHQRSKLAARALAAVEDPTPLDAMSNDQLLDRFAALYESLPPRPLGWTTDDAIREVPAIGREMARINAHVFA